MFVCLATHPCVTMPAVVCKNNGICTVDGSDYKCNCANGWTGRNCETAIGIMMFFLGSENVEYYFVV